MPLVGKSKAVAVLSVSFTQSTRVWRGPFWSYAKLLPSQLHTKSVVLAPDNGRCTNISLVDESGHKDKLVIYVQ